METKETRLTMKRVRLRLCVKEAAEGKGFTFLSLSAASQVDVKTVRRLWNHPETDVLMSTLQRIAAPLDISPLDLLIVEAGVDEEA